jgi:PHD/YefM family antitoxin component YafN of YafNO toxin-antitoxin module
MQPCGHAGIRFGRLTPRGHAGTVAAMTTRGTIHPLADFQENAKTHVLRLKKTGRPEILTINGKPAIVVQDASSYQRLLAALERAEAIAGIKRGLESLAHGEGELAGTVFNRLRRKYKIPVGA